MSQVQLYFTGLVISLLLSISVVLYLRKPLFTLLSELCGTEDRARFWMQITNLSFMLMSMLMAFTYQPERYYFDYYYITGHLGRTLFGLLLVTGFLTFNISLFIRRTDKAIIKSQGSHEKAS